jgi:hypothetical protein
MKAKAGWSFADVASLDKNDSVYGEIESNWQAFDGDNLSLNAVASRDTAFTGFSRDYKLGLLNEMFLLGDMAAGLGARYQDEHLYPLARLTWRPFSRGCFTASYEPGMIKPDWASLYVADSFVSINNDLPVCENVFALKESFSYYWGKQGEGNIEFYQEHQRNGVYWVRDALNNTIMPITLDDMFRSGCTIKAVYGGKYFKPECNIALSGQKDLPFTPQYSADIKLGLRYGVFTLTPAINTVGERRASLNGELMAGYSDISCKIAYDVKNDVTLAVEALNISGEAIETQPGFVQHLPSAQGSVEFRF